MQRAIRATQSLVMRDTLKRMKRVLRRLGHTDADNVIQLKGRVACEISTADELLVTQLIFDGVFNDLTVQQTVALLSCLVFQEKGDDDAKVPDEMAGPLRQLQEAAKRVATVSLESKIAIVPDEYVASFKPHLVEATLAWCNGARFADICEMTSVFEGTIIRCLRRLEELLRQLASAAKAIGDEALEKKFEAGQAKLKRDIVFAASLYL